MPHGFSLDIVELTLGWNHPNIPRWLLLLLCVSHPKSECAPHNHILVSFLPARPPDAGAGMVGGQC